MTRIIPSMRLPVRRWLLTAVCALAALGAGAWVGVRCRAQVPVNPDLEVNFALVVYDGDAEVGRVYRDVAGARYTEHWVLYPNYRFDQIRRPGASIQIVAERDAGYRSVEDFLDRVPFPKGSRYVIACCQEFDQLPGD
jgi:hypothetical protein